MEQGFQVIEQLCGSLVGSGVGTDNGGCFRERVACRDPSVQDRAGKVQLHQIGILHQDAVAVQVPRDDVDDLVQELRAQEGHLVYGVAAPVVIPVFHEQVAQKLPSLCLIRLKGNIALI